MKTTLLVGKPVADHLRKRLSNVVQTLADASITPGLAAVIVGDDPASQVYVRNKERAFAKLGCYSKTIHLPQNTTEEEILNLIRNLNNDPAFHGILVQLPLPKHLNSRIILHAVNPKKDVDGFHPENLGLLLEGNPGFVPCTPNGILEILKYYQIPVNGRHAVIVGRSNIVGKPMFALLCQKFEMGNATVSICHTGTQNINQFTKQADILIAAAGSPGMITGEMLKQGVDIIDVGINRVEDDSEKGYHLCGDVDTESVMGIANSVTPVPGGVGPLTITMLLSNTIKSAKRNLFN